MSSRPASRWAAVGFWLVAVAAVPALTLTWFQFGLSFSGRPDGRCSLLEVGAAVVTDLPLVLGHLGVLLVLMLLALPATRTRAAAVWATAAGVVVPSLVGILAAQWFWRGELFATGPAGGFCGL